MSGVTNTLKNTILDALFNGTLGPAEQFLTLCSSTVLPGDTGATIVEPTWAGFTRLPMKTADWKAASGGSKVNLTLMEFATVVGAGRSAINFATCTTEEPGTGLIVVSGVIPLTVFPAGIKPKFEAGTLVVTVGDS